MKNVMSLDCLHCIRIYSDVQFKTQKLANKEMVNFLINNFVFLTVQNKNNPAEQSPWAIIKL